MDKVVNLEEHRRRREKPVALLPAVPILNKAAEISGPDDEGPWDGDAA